MEQTYAPLKESEYKPKRVDVDCTDYVIADAVEIEWKDALSYLDPYPSPQVLHKGYVESSWVPVQIRALTTHIPSLSSQNLRLSQAVVPIPAVVLGHVAASLQDFEALWQNDAGGTTLLDAPRRLLMQTPNDGDLFCSMILQTNGFREAADNILLSTDLLFTAILISSDPTIKLPKIAPLFHLPPLWNTTDLPIVFLPLEFLIQHVRRFSEKLAELTTEVSCIEEIVINDNILPAQSEQFTNTFKGLIKRLHVCSREIIKLRRRWHFQMTLGKTIVDLIETHDPQIVATRRNIRNEIQIRGNVDFGSGMVNMGNDTNNHNTTLTESLEYRQLLSVASLQHKLSQSLEYDLDVLPTRVANQFNAIFNLMTQSDTQASISIAISSRKDNEYMQNIAAATLRDSSSMKTVAILTMVFLPGTFICSFFSMTMFNWNSQPGEPLVSPYIWAYFAAMVPLTLLVITIWWWKTKESRREQEEDRKKRRLARGHTMKV